MVSKGFKAVREFLCGNNKAFGYYIDEFEDGLLFTSDTFFIVHINNLKKRKQVLQWYLDLNTTGRPHTNEEIEKVVEMLNAEG